MKKIKINILVQGGSIQSIFVDEDASDKISIDIFDLDNNPDQDENWDAVTMGQKEFA